MRIRIGLRAGMCPERQMRFQPGCPSGLPRSILPHSSRRWNIPSSPAISKMTELSESRQFAIDAARMLSNTRCHNVVVLDVTGLSPVTDFLILATGTSPIQMKSAADEIIELGDPRGFRPLTR